METLDELKSEGYDENTLLIFTNSITEFTPNGKVELLLPVSKEMIDEMGDEIIELRDDNIAVIDAKNWKTEDGKNLYNSEIEGEFLGEEVSPWEEITEIGDMIEFGLIRYVRAD